MNAHFAQQVNIQKTTVLTTVVLLVLRVVARILVLGSALSVMLASLQPLMDLPLVSSASQVATPLPLGSILPVLPVPLVAPQSTIAAPRLASRVLVVRSVPLVPRCLPLFCVRLPPNTSLAVQLQL